MRHCMTLRVSSPLNCVPWAPHLSHPSLGLVNCLSVEISFKMLARAATVWWPKAWLGQQDYCRNSSRPRLLEGGCSLSLQGPLSGHLSLTGQLASSREWAGRESRRSSHCGFCDLVLPVTHHHFHHILFCRIEDYCFHYIIYQNWVTKSSPHLKGEEQGPTFGRKECYRICGQNV